MRGLFCQGPVGGVVGLVLLLALGACGFRPMAGANGAEGAVTAQLASVRVSVIKDRSGQILRNLLIDSFSGTSHPADPEYQLDVALEAGEDTLAVQKDASVSRGQWTVTANYRLVHIASGRVMFQASSRAISGYNSTFVQYASFVSEESAYQRGIEYLSGEIKTRVALFFARAPDQRPSTAPGAAPAAPLEAVPLPGAADTGWKRSANDDLLNPLQNVPGALGGYTK